MRLCIITPSFMGGGAERIAVNLANHYTAEGHDVSLLVFKGVGPYRDQVDGKVRLIDLDISRTRYVFFKLWRAIRKENPTHVLSVIRGSNIVVGLVGIIHRKLKIVFREANTMDGIAQLPLYKRLAFKIMMKVGYGRAYKIIANSDDTASDLIKNGIVRKNKVVVIGNPVLPANFQDLAAEPAKHPWLLDNDLYVLLNVGRLHRQKNQSLLVKSFASVFAKQPLARLILVGEGEEKDSLHGLISSLGLSSYVAIMPFCENPYPYYKNADLFVLTSDWEGFGNVLVEAMGCGIPIISTDCPGGPRHILNNGALGKLTPVGDVEKLAKAIESSIRERYSLDVSPLIDRAGDFTIDSIGSIYLQELS